MKYEKIICCVIVSLAFVVICKDAINSHKNSGRHIYTNGLSSRDIVSDYAVWNIGIQNEAQNNVKDSQTKRSADKAAVLNFLKKNGLSESIVEESFSISDNWRRHDYNSKGNTKRPRFEIVDTITVKSTDVQKIQKAIAGTGESLVSVGVNVSNVVKYLYSQMEKLRIAMIEDATRDSKTRAEHVAQVSGCKIKEILSLETGRFSMVAADSSDAASGESSSYYYGSEGEESVNKRIRVVVHGAYRVE
ncbi:MAG: SIMPL domain-containing protein [Holosporales bacterium]|jgi:hypothetical protein|nr:SIMPL domain-containing protein [Holosporales bacterium]